MTQQEKNKNHDLLVFADNTNMGLLMNVNIDEKNAVKILVSCLIRAANGYMYSGNSAESLSNSVKYYVEDYVKRIEALRTEAI